MRMTPEEKRLQEGAVSDKEMTEIRAILAHPLSYDPNTEPSKGVVDFPLFATDSSGNTLPTGGERVLNLDPNFGRDFFKNPIGILSVAEGTPLKLGPNEFCITEDPDTGELEHHQGLPEPRRYEDLE